MKICIKSATVIIPNHQYHNKVVDVLIKNGKIVKIDSKISSDADKIIEHENLHLSLGWFDSCVSFGEPGFEERETLDNGLQTAAKSGFTAIGLNPNTSPVIDTNASISFIKNFDKKFGVNIHPIGALTKGSKGKDLAELYDMQQAGAISFGDYKKPIQNPNLLKIALQYAQGFNGLIQSFPQENAIARNGLVNEGEQSTLLGLNGIPALAEELQIARDLFLLEYTGGKLHIPQISSEKSIQLIKDAKKKGLDVTCSVAIHQLFFSEEVLKDFDTKYKVLPPLRTNKDKKALVKAVKNGDIDFVTTDHMPIDIEEKKVEFEHAEFGTIGLESAFGALQKTFGLEKSVELLSKGRTRFGLDEPTFEEDKKANLSFFIPEENYTFSKNDIFSTSKNSIFLEHSLKGKVLGSFANNKLTLA